MRILSVDGGGYLGLASAAFLEEIERHFQTSAYNQFDLFCGTSTGAIIALGLASGRSAAEIVKLYERFGARVFRNPIPGSRTVRSIVGIVKARYSNRGLRIVLTEAFGNQALGDLAAKGKHVLITAFNLSTGRPRVFKTDHAPELSQDDGYLIRDVALASAAAPVFLPVVTLTSPTSGVAERFCDGGLFANHPALLGYAEAVSHLQSHPEAIQVLSLSTPRLNLAEYPSARSSFRQYALSRGLLGWGTKLPGIMIDSTSLVAHEMLRRIIDWPPGTHNRYVRVPLERPPGTDLDIVTAQATATLRHLGRDKACQTEIRQRLSRFFA